MYELKKMFIIIVLPIIILGFAFFWIFITVNSANEEIVENILPMTINGVILNKKIDMNNHATKSVTIKTHNDNILELYDSYWFGIYDEAEIGDSLYKHDGNLSLYLIDNLGISTEIKYLPSRLYFHKRDWLRKLQNK